MASPTDQSETTPSGLTSQRTPPAPAAKNPLAELGCSPTLGHEPKALQASECNELLDPKLPKGDPPLLQTPALVYSRRDQQPLLCTLVHGLHYRMYTLQGWLSCRETFLAGEQVCDNMEGEWQGIRS